MRSESVTETEIMSAVLSWSLAFMILGISLSDQLRERVYPRVIRKTRVKRESNLAHHLEVRENRGRRNTEKAETDIKLDIM